MKKSIYQFTYLRNLVYQKMELIEASLAYNLEDVVSLLNSGVDIDFRDKCGCTSLIWSSYRGYLEIVNLLIQNNANVNIKDYKYGYTPLVWASISDNLEIIDLLIKNGADVNSKDKLDRTPLMIASIESNLKTVRFLLSKGADINVKDNNGDTCLQLSYRFNKISFVKYFLCLEQLDKTIRETFLDNTFSLRKKEFNNYIQAINKLKKFRNRVKRYSAMCGLTPKKFYNLNKLIKKREFLEWWYAPQGYGGKRHLENMRRWFSVVHGV